MMKLLSREGDDVIVEDDEELLDFEDVVPFAAILSKVVHTSCSLAASLYRIIMICH